MLPFPEKVKHFRKRDPVTRKDVDSLGKRMAQARRELGVRLRRDVQQSDVASALGVGAATVSRWEADQAVPREDALAKLAAFLEVTPMFLRYGIPVDYQPVAPDPMKDRRVTPAERAAAKKIVDAATPRRKRGNG